MIAIRNVVINVVEDGRNCEIICAWVDAHVGSILISANLWDLRAQFAEGLNGPLDVTCWDVGFPVKQNNVSIHSHTLTVVL